MKQALISPSELVGSGYRVADVSEIPFAVAEPLFWVECEDSVTPVSHFYDPSTETILVNEIPEVVVGAQPKITGTVEL